MQNIEFGLIPLHFDFTMINIILSQLVMYRHTICIKNRLFLEYNSMSWDYSSVPIQFISILVLFCVSCSSNEVTFNTTKDFQYIVFDITYRYSYCSLAERVTTHRCCNGSVASTHSCRSGLCNLVRGVVHCGKILLLSRAGQVITTSCYHHCCCCGVWAQKLLEDLQFKLGPFMSYKLC